MGSELETERTDERAPRPVPALLSAAPVALRIPFIPLDAIDNGQLKKAVQLASKILKKDGDLVCAKVG